MVEVCVGAGLGISIHALHEESDMRAILRPHGQTYFNPRSP